MGAPPNTRQVIPAADRKSEAFVVAHHDLRGRQFTTEEQEIRVGGRSVAGGAQRPMGSTARRSTSVLRRLPRTRAPDRSARPGKLVMIV